MDDGDEQRGERGDGGRHQAAAHERGRAEPPDDARAELRHADQPAELTAKTRLNSCGETPKMSSSTNDEPLM